MAMFWNVQDVSEMIAVIVGTRSAAQVRSHVQKVYIRMERSKAGATRQTQGGVS